MGEFKEVDKELLSRLDELYSVLTHRDQRLGMHEQFMMVAMVMSARSTCLSRKVGAVLIKDKNIIATGYCGSPRGYSNCCDLGYCIRKDSPVGVGLDDCPSVHAEANCINQAARHGHKTKGATIYVTTQPCKWCMSDMANAGIVKVIYDKPYPSELSNKIAKGCDIEVISFKELIKK